MKTLCVVFLFVLSSFLICAEETTECVEVVGEVRAPQKVPMREYLTLLGAIAECGGFTDFANRRKVLLIREGSRKEYNAKEMMENPDADVLLNPNDRIVVQRVVF